MLAKYWLVFPSDFCDKAISLITSQTRLNKIYTDSAYIDYKIQDHVRFQQLIDIDTPTEEKEYCKHPENVSSTT